jgi:hypothetical protein
VRPLLAKPFGLREVLSVLDQIRADLL